jgi:TRAP-type C4-dicarboxylate transport system permease small subunit
LQDVLFNAAMAAFFAVMVWVSWTKHIHTGFFGSVGCAWSGTSALFFIDDSLYNGQWAVESAVMSMCGGFGLVLLHVLLRARRSGRGAWHSGMRRSSDWMGLDGEDHGDPPDRRLGGAR